jgi:hypothetical protein
MSSEAQKFEHLGDHLPYELLMLRYAYEPTGEDHYQLAWNAYYESFALHARILFDFLTNKKDRGNINFVATDFVTGFTAKEDEEVRRLVNQNLNWQVFHFGKQRKSELEKKLGTEERKKIFDWIDRTLRDLNLS